MQTKKQLKVQYIGIFEEILKNFCSGFSFSSEHFPSFENWPLPHLYSQQVCAKI